MIEGHSLLNKMGCVYLIQGTQFISQYGNSNLNPANKIFIY